MLYSTDASETVAEIAVVKGNAAVVPCYPPFSRPQADIEFELNGTRLILGGQSFQTRNKGLFLVTYTIGFDYVLMGLGCLWPYEFNHWRLVGGGGPPLPTSHLWFVNDVLGVF